MRFLILLLLIPALQGCLPPPPPPHSVNVDKQIFQSRHWNLAVLDLEYKPIEGTQQAGVVSSVSASSDAGQVVASLLANEFGKLGNISIVERGQMNELLGEQKLQMSGVIDSRTAKEIGKILGADAVVIGSVSDYVSWTALLLPGSTVSFSMRMIDVQTGKVIISGSITKSDDFSIAFQNAQNLAQQLITEVAAQ
jgi:curli biogenesis system outer membrane secretion channel CsgG